MLTTEDVPYGILYSFQPDYLAQLQAANLDHKQDSEDGPEEDEPEILLARTCSIFMKYVYMLSGKHY